MACACTGRPKCVDGKKAWYLKMMAAKKQKQKGFINVPVSVRKKRNKGQDAP